MNKPQIELEAKDNETPVQKKHSLKLKGIRLPKFKLKDKLHNFNNNREQLLKTYLAAIILFSLTFWSIDTFIDEDFLLENIHPVDYFYFSVVTITTLGYGEMLPGTWVAKLMVSALTLFGLYVLGMFLTATGNHTHKKEREIKDERLLFDRVEPIKMAIKNFNRSTTNEIGSIAERYYMRHPFTSPEVCSEDLAMEARKVLESFEQSDNSFVIILVEAINKFLQDAKIYADMVKDSGMTFSMQIRRNLERDDILKIHMHTVNALDKAIDGFLASAKD